MNRILDIANIRNKMLVAKKINHKTSKNVIWECHCDCGNIVFLHCGNFYRNQSCGCLKNKRGNKHPAWKGCGELSHNFFNKIRSTAKIGYFARGVTRQNYYCGRTKSTYQTNTRS